MFPADLLGLVHSAGGIERLPGHFAPTSRERLIDEPRRLWPWLREDGWMGTAAEQEGGSAEAGARVERSAALDLTDPLC